MGLFDKLFGRGDDEVREGGTRASQGGGAENVTPSSAAAAPESYSPQRVREYGPTAEGLPPIIQWFQPVRPIAEDTIARLGAQVPAAVVELWRTYGEGFVGDGYLRVLDPERISPEGQLNPDPGAIALMNTALNDTIFWHGPVKAFICVKWRQSVMDLVSLNDPVDPREALRRFADPAFQERALEKRHFREWLGRGGAVPDLTQGLFHVPAPAIGGPFLSRTLQEGQAFVSQMIYLQFDPPRLRHEDPDRIEPSPDYGTPPAGD